MTDSLKNKPLKLPGGHLLSFVTKEDIEPAKGHGPVSSKGCFGALSWLILRYKGPASARASGRHSVAGIQELSSMCCMDQREDHRIELGSEVWGATNVQLVRTGRSYCTL